MTHLLDLSASLALAVWAASLMCGGMAQLCGLQLRRLFLKRADRASAASLGAAFTLLQPSTRAATGQLSDLLARRLLTLPAALAALGGAELGLALLGLPLLFAPGWSSALLLLAGVLGCAGLRGERARTIGQALVGAGLLLLAVQLARQAALELFATEVAALVVRGLGDDRLLLVTAGAAAAWVLRSSLPAVLLVAFVAAGSSLGLAAVSALLLGVNLGAALLGVSALAKAAHVQRQLALGHLLLRATAVAGHGLLLLALAQLAAPSRWSAGEAVVLNIAFNLSALLLASLALGGLAARLAQRLLPEPPSHDAPQLQHLDPLALDTPSLALANAVRAAMQQADLLEDMLRGLTAVVRQGELEQLRALRTLDERVDRLHAEIKHYLTGMRRDGLSVAEHRRWAELVNFTINLAQAGDVAKHMLQDLEQRMIAPRRSLSAGHVAAVEALLEQLLANLRLALSVLLHQRPADARRLLQQKTALREAALASARHHLARLTQEASQSRDTSALYLDLLSGLRRINSHLCAGAYAVLDQDEAPAVGPLSSAA